MIIATGEYKACSKCGAPVPVGCVRYHIVTCNDCIAKTPKFKARKMVLRRKYEQAGSDNAEFLAYTTALMELGQS